MSDRPIVVVAATFHDANNYVQENLLGNGRVRWTYATPEMIHGLVNPRVFWVEGWTANRYAGAIVDILNQSFTSNQLRETEML